MQPSKVEGALLVVGGPCTVLVHLVCILLPSSMVCATTYQTAVRYSSDHAFDRTVFALPALSQFSGVVLHLHTTCTQAAGAQCAIEDMFVPPHKFQHTRLEGQSEAVNGKVDKKSPHPRSFYTTLMRTRVCNLVDHHRGRTMTVEDSYTTL